MRAGTQLLGDVTRHSRALDVELISDPDERASREVRNGLRQFDAVVEMVEHHLSPERPFRLRVSTILHLQRFALEGISTYAGVFRPAGIEIGGSKHQPIGAHQVPESVEELCDYVNSKWNEKSPIHLLAYVLWRLNWIHPFVDGNGRTSRATSYLVLNLRLGYLLPGSKNTIPQQIQKIRIRITKLWKPQTRNIVEDESIWTKWKSCFPRCLPANYTRCTNKR